MELDVKKAIAKRIKELRFAKKITQKQLAEALDISYRSVVDYENGRREPNAKALVALERYFDVSGEYLRGETEERHPKYKWEYTDRMAQISTGMPRQLEILAEAIAPRTDLEKHMVFDIFVEMRHILCSKRLNDEQKQATLLLLQRMFTTSTFFADACAAAKADEPEGIARLEKGKADAIDRTAQALTTAMENIIQSKVFVEE